MARRMNRMDRKISRLKPQGRYSKRVSGKFRNKRPIKVEVNKLRDEIGNLQVEDKVVDRPVDLYTDIYANITTQTLGDYEINETPPIFDSEIKLNDLANAGTTIISDENQKTEWLETKLYVPMGKRCMRIDATEEVLMTSGRLAFTDLNVKHLERPRVAPTIDQFEIANIYRSFEDGRTGQSAKLPMTDYGRSHVLDMLGRNKDPNSHKFSIRANHHFIAVADAFNWIDDETDEESREGITFKWVWTAGSENYEKNDIDKIVGTSRILTIENIQREHAGTYTCQVENKFGKQWSFPIDLDVERPGEVREVRITVTNPNGEESEILTNQYEWIPNDASDEHDEKIKTTDNKHVFDFINNEWVSIYWNPSTEKWYREDDNTTYGGDDVEPARGETWEDADEPGKLNDDMGYRI
jgi:hypothetical protein